MLTFETERLILRPWKKGDLYDLHEYCRQPEVGPMAGWAPHVLIGESLDYLNKYLIGNEGNWAMEFRENRKVIGSIGLRMDEKRTAKYAYALGYSMSRNYWGHGLMTEGTGVIIPAAFEKFNGVILSCYHYPHNQRSKRVIEKNGFHYEGTLRHCGQLPSGEVYDELCYSLTRWEYENEFKARKAK